MEVKTYTIDEIKKYRNTYCGEISDCTGISVRFLCQRRF